MHNYCIGLLLICLITVLSQDCAILYSKCDYLGESIKVCDDKPTLKSFQTKSAKIPNGMVVTVYDDTYFQGRSLELRQDIACIEENNFSDNKIKLLESELANVKTLLKSSETELADVKAKQQQSDTELALVKQQSSANEEKLKNLENEFSKLNKKQQIVGMFSTKLQVSQGGIFGNALGIIFNQLIQSKPEYIQQSEDFRYIQILKTGFYKITFIVLSQEGNSVQPCLLKNNAQYLMCSYARGQDYDTANAETYEQLQSDDKIYVISQGFNIFVNQNNGALYHRIHIVYLGEQF